METWDCQDKVQNSEGSESINTIDGNLRNVKEKGLCFEKKVLEYRIQITMDFIKKLGENHCLMR